MHHFSASASVTERHNSRSIDHAHAKRLGAALPALLLGVVLVFAAGFAHSERVHDAAHDARHAHGMPCH